MKVIFICLLSVLLNLDGRQGTITPCPSEAISSQSDQPEDPKTCLGKDKIQILSQPSPSLALAAQFQRPPSISATFHSLKILTVCHSGSSGGIAF
jgi:hypothetical protein